MMTPRSVQQHSRTNRPYIPHCVPLLAFLIVASIVQAQETTVLTPDTFGYREAQSDTDRFWAIWSLHHAAAQSASPISYEGFDTITIAIPAGASSIPLQSHNDFSHTVFRVTNNTANITLFQWTGAPFVNLAPNVFVKPRADKFTCMPRQENDCCKETNDSACNYDILNAAVDKGDFSAVPQLREGVWLVQVTDSLPWVTQREGYTYGHYRKDLIVVRNGHSSDRPTAPYGGTPSKATLQGVRLDNTDTAAPADTHLFLGNVFVKPRADKFTCMPRRENDCCEITNITLLRDSTSTFQTYLVKIDRALHVTLRNITVVTPLNQSANDRIINISDCADVLLDSVTLLGSYSRTDHSGYGLLMDNIRRLKAIRLFARSAWGIFGTNNIHTSELVDCDFDRFDIHCYGHDVTFRRCTQRDSYNQFSSVLGTIVYDSCTLLNFTPILTESSYNAYPHYQLRMTNCRWHITPQHHTLIQAGKLGTSPNPRAELSTKCLPDIDIENLTIETERGLTPILVHYSGQRIQQPIGGVRHISISYTSPHNTLRLKLSDRRVPLSKPIPLSLQGPTTKKQKPNTITHL